MASSSQVAPPITLTAPLSYSSDLEATKPEDPHRHRRRFIGPLPESVFLSSGDKLRDRRRRFTKFWSKANSSQEDEDASLRSAIQQHALQFFLGHGGRREDWGETTEHHVREEMLRKWAESEWGRLRRERKEAKVAKRWVGNSFDVGIFLGVDILHQKLSQISTESNKVVESPTERPEAPPLLSLPSETFVTARSQFSRSGSGLPGTAPLLTEEANGPSSSSSNGPRLRKALSVDSSTALLSAIESDGSEHAHTDVGHNTSGLLEEPPRLTTESDTSLVVGATAGKGKGKMVHYAEDVLSGTGTSAEEPPAPPEEVLARTGSEVEDTSAGAAQQATMENQIPWGDVIMRDRMLVRSSYTESESVPGNFDEAQNRTTPHISHDDWSEFIVAWRKDRLELYGDHRLPGKEWFSGTKRLAFVIPLGVPTTRLSIFSFVDLTFCLTCAPYPLRATSRGKWIRSGSKKGTNIFVFKVKSRTRAADWIWHMWRHMGGELPPFIEVRAPALDTRMKIDIPHYNSADINAAYEVFTKPNIVSICQKGLQAVPEYEALIAHQLRNGASLELAWRVDTILDWVWQLSDVTGKIREWAVLCGLAIKQGQKPTHLELRIKQHLPTRIHLRDGTRLDEPPAIEGYLERIRPPAQLKQSVYLVTHGGYLFALSLANANPPMPPGPLDMTSSAETLHEAEVHRGTKQIMNATGVTDLRSILAVRRAFQVVPVQSEPVDNKRTRDWEDSEEFWMHGERFEGDDEDKGGEEGLIHTTDKPTLRMRRSFELLMTNGRVVRFETYSCVVALEWITRLRPLISYWKKKHQVDAREEMDLAHFGTGRPRMTPHRRIDHEDATPEAPPDPDASLPELSAFYNWCTLDSCRPILKIGRLFARKGLRGHYKHIQLVLVSGHLVTFLITGKSSLHSRQRKLINLLDAYTCSGYLAAQHLPDGQYHPDSPPLARRYQDGLESDECEEDTLFTLWYRAHVIVTETPSNAEAYSTKERPKKAGSDVPPLSGKRKLAVYRTRSKLERDAWVWAINAEIDKAVRAAEERESRVREAGELMKKE